MEALRRTTLKCVAAALAASILRPLCAMAAVWDKELFANTNLSAALRSYGAGGAQASDRIVLTAPDVAENAAAVPIEVTSHVPGTEEIAVFAEKNPLPLACRFIFPEGIMASVSLRLRLAETTPVRVVAKAGGKFYMAAREVKVVAGGCG